MKQCTIVDLSHLLGKIFFFEYTQDDPRLEYRKMSSGPREIEKCIVYHKKEIIGALQIGQFDIFNVDWLQLSSPRSDGYVQALASDVHFSTDRH